MMGEEHGECLEDVSIRDGEGLVHQRITNL